MVSLYPITENRVRFTPNLTNLTPGSLPRESLQHRVYIYTTLQKQIPQIISKPFAKARKWSSDLMIAK